MYRNNSLHPRVERHISYVIGIEEQLCDDINLLNISDMCEFAKFVPACHESEYYISYSDIVFCNLLQQEISWVLIYLFLSLLLVLYILAITVILITCVIPNLLSISNFVKFSEHSSAALLITFLTCAHRLICAAQNINSVDTILVINELQGSALLLRSFIGGYILTLGPLHLHPMFVIRDQIIYFVGLLLLSFMFIKERVHMNHAICTMSVYLVFVVICLIQEWLTQKKVNAIKRKIRKLEILRSFVNWKLHHNPLSELRSKQKVLYLNEVIDALYESYFAIKPFTIPVNDRCNFGPGKHQNSFLYQQFFASIDPRKTAYKRQCRAWEKFMLSLGFPFHIFVSIIIPVVNPRLPLQGWSKLLNCINLVFAPLLVIGIYKIPAVGGIILYGPVSIFAITSFYFTRTDRIPKFHIVYAIIGIFICVSFLVVISREIDALLHLFGILSSMSRAAIGNMFVAWSSSLPEIVLTFSLLGLGYRRMAYIVIINRPLVQMVFSSGFSIYLHHVNRPEVALYFRSGTMGETGLIFIFIEFISSFLLDLLTDFYLRESVGYFKMLLYLIFVLFIILEEIAIIHGYGSDHQADETPALINAWL